MKIFLLTLFCALAFLLTQAQYREGYYIDSNNNKITGLLEYDYGNILTADSKGAGRLLYKSDANAKRIKLTSRDIKGFVIGSDSFTVLHKADLKSFINYSQDFARVLEFGPITLYQYVVVGNNSTSSYIPYLLVKKNDSTVLLSTVNVFRKTMEKWTIDDPEVHNRIVNKQLKYNDARQVVHQYNMDMASSGALPR